MREEDLEESKNVEDRREEEPEEELSPREKQTHALTDTISAIAGTPDEAEGEGLSAEAGLNEIPYANRWEQVRGTYAKGTEKASYAGGGPVASQSTLTRIAEHPIFPENVKIQHVRIPALTASSEDMSTVYINTNVPTTINVNGKRVPTAAPLAVYELYSRAGIEVLKEACAQEQYCPADEDVEDVAREQAGETAEKQFLVEHYGFDDADWEAYCNIMLEGAGRKLVTTQQGTGG